MQRDIEDTTTAARGHTAHRANYTLERGMWRATCRKCGFTLTDVSRQRAMSLYRAHIRETGSADERVAIDLLGSDENPPTPAIASA